MTWLALRKIPHSGIMFLGWDLTVLALPEMSRFTRAAQASCLESLTRYSKKHVTRNRLVGDSHRDRMQLSFIPLSESRGERGEGEGREVDRLQEVAGPREEADRAGRARRLPALLGDPRPRRRLRHRRRGHEPRPPGTAAGQEGELGIQGVPSIWSGTWVAIQLEFLAA